MYIEKLCPKQNENLSYLNTAVTSCDKEFNYFHSLMNRGFAGGVMDSDLE